MSTLREQGYRLVYTVGGTLAWKHPLEVESTDHDLTDATDDEFMQFIERANAGAQPFWVTA